MKFTGKWIELGKKIIPSEVTLTQKEKNINIFTYTGY